MTAMPRGVYVWPLFPGLTEVRAVGSSGDTLARLTLQTAHSSRDDTDMMWQWLNRVDPVLDRVDPVPTLALIRD